MQSELLTIRFNDPLPTPSLCDNHLGMPWVSIVHCGPIGHSNGTQVERERERGESERDGDVTAGILYGGINVKLSERANETIEPWR